MGVLLMLWCRISAILKLHNLLGGVHVCIILLSIMHDPETAVWAVAAQRIVPSASRYIAA